MVPTDDSLHRCSATQKRNLSTKRHRLKRLPSLQFCVRTLPFLKLWSTTNGTALALAQVVQSEQGKFAKRRVSIYCQKAELKFLQICLAHMHTSLTAVIVETCFGDWHCSSGGPLNRSILWPSASAESICGQEDFAKSWGSLFCQKIKTESLANMPCPYAHLTLTSSSQSICWTPAILAGKSMKRSTIRICASAGYACGRGEYAQNWSSVFC